MKKMIWKIIFRIRYFYAKFFRKKKLKKMRERLRNKDFSIVASNCCGAILLHDLGLQFRTPTVNCFFYAEDFVKFCEKLQHYLLIEPQYLYDAKEGYPVCIIDDIKVYAMHYKNAEEFVESWNRRVARVNLENLFIMMTDRDGFKEELLERIEKIPYKKILFSHKEYKEYDFVCYVPQFKTDKQVGDMFKFGDCRGNRYYEKAFDCIAWLNGEI